MEEPVKPFADDHWRLLPTSSVMPYSEAKNIAAAFGILVFELHEIKRQTLDTTFSLPVRRLGHSKQRIQTALAISVAQLVVEYAFNPSGEVRELINATPPCSGSLVWFTREPVDPVEGSKTLKLDFASGNLYFSWQRVCEGELKKAAGERPDDEAVNWWEAENLLEYWHAIDRLLPDLLNHPVLAAIRAT